MERTKETPCVATFISNKQKFHFFYFFFYKLENRRVEQALPTWGRLVPVGGGGGRERGRRMNIVQIMCTHVCKCENDTC
jgi:hypothetical protein